MGEEILEISYKERIKMFLQVINERGDRVAELRALVTAQKNQLKRNTEIITELKRQVIEYEKENTELRGF